MRDGTESESIDISLRGRLGGFQLDAAFEAPMLGITALFGPSGCGKTSILRCIAGLQHLPGKIGIGGEVWQDGRIFRPPHKRPIGYVFQEASLFAHLSVRQNLSYGQRRSKNTAQSIRFEEVVELLGLSRLIDRNPVNLSGGERQRVSIGRALLSQPRLLLMDEPLSALDRMAKDEILPYFEALHASLRVPILFVTHDISEVERLADHLVVLDHGRVVSAGPLHRALTDSASPFGRARDSASVLPAIVSRRDPDGIVALDVQGTEILAPDDGFGIGRKVRVRIAANDVSIARERASDSSILNLIAVRIMAIERLNSAQANVRLSLGQDADLVARLSCRSVAMLKLEVGDSVIAQIKGVSVVATG